MTIYSFEGKVPEVDQLAHIHEDATIIGDVVIGQECFIGAGAIIRGDYGKIEIGDRTAVEEGCVIHAPPDETCKIGNDVIIGHGAIIHCSRTEDCAFIGMGAVLSIHAVIGESSIIGEGAVVTQDQVIPPKKIAVGNPAKVIKDVPEERKEVHAWGTGLYAGLSKRYKEGLQKL